MNYYEAWLNLCFVLLANSYTINVIRLKLLKLSSNSFKTVKKTVAFQLP